MNYLAYADAFIPTPMASVAMGEAAAMSEMTWADEQPKLTPFKFLLLLPESEALGWWQYLHWRFPLALGWGAGAYPVPTPLYIDPSRWIPNYLKADENLFSLVVAKPESVKWERLDVQGVLVLLGVSDVPNIDASFKFVARGANFVIGVDYLGVPASWENAEIAIPPRKQIVPAVLPPRYWESLLPL
jgi:hypothetical protein